MILFGLGGKIKKKKNEISRFLLVHRYAAAVLCTVPIMLYRILYYDIIIITIAHVGSGARRMNIDRHHAYR